MAHHIYQTKGLIIAGFDSGESNRFLVALTEELGVVRLHVQGLRQLRSKLRYALQVFSLAKLNIIRGKNVWKITSAEHIHTYPQIREDEAKRLVVAKIFMLLNRLVVGEERNEDIYHDVIGVMELLEAHDLDIAEVKGAELLAVSRVLKHLGYWGGDDELAHFLEGDVWNSDATKRAHAKRREFTRHINTALNESHL